MLRIIARGGTPNNNRSVLLIRCISQTAYLTNEHDINTPKASSFKYESEANVKDKDQARETNSDSKSRFNGPIILDYHKTGVIKKQPSHLSKYFTDPGSPHTKGKGGNASKEKQTNSVSATAPKKKGKRVPRVQEAQEGLQSREQWDLGIYNHLHGNDRDELLVFKTDASENQLIDSIDEIKPFNSNISPSEYSNIQKKLLQAYTKKDFLAYLRHALPSSQKVTTLRKKLYYTEKILSDVWNVKVDELKIDSTSRDFESVRQGEIVVTKRFKANDKLLFFLLSENQKLIYFFAWNQIKLGLYKDKYIVVTGLESKVRWFEAKISILLSQQSNRLVNLQKLDEFFSTTDESIDNKKSAGLNEAEIKDFTSEAVSAHKAASSATNTLSDFLQNKLLVNHISKVSDVFFSKVSDSAYVLFARSETFLNKASRLLIWYLNYNSHLTSHFANLSRLTDIPMRFYKFSDSISVPWIYKDKDWFRLRTPVFRKKYEPVAADVIKGQEAEFKEVEEFEEELDSDKGREKGAIEDTKTEEAVRITNTELKTIDSITDKEINTIYENLLDFTIKNKEAKGMFEQQWNSPIITATFGQVLFNNDVKSGLSETKLPLTNFNDFASKPIKPYFFHSSLPAGKKQILKLPLFEDVKSESSEQDRDIFDSFDDASSLDYHSYHVHLKLTPSPFFQSKKNPKFYESDVKYYKDYPPVELFLELNEQDEVQWDTLKAFSVERESNVFVNLPDKVADIKLSATISSTLVDAQETESEATGEPSNIEKDFKIEQNIKETKENGLFEDLEEQPKSKNFEWMTRNTKTPSRSEIPKFLESQPGLYEFFKKTKFDAKGKSAVAVKPNSQIRFIDPQGDAQDIPYLYQSLTYRRTLDLKFNNEYLLQFTVSEGGAVGGKSTEISLHNLKAGEDVSEKVNGESQISKEEFKQFFKNALGFVDKVSSQ